MGKYKVAGYVKLAKLWEKNKEKAIAYHKEYFKQKFLNSSCFELINVYVDITGKKEIYNREAMIMLLSDISLEKIDCIYTPTKAYLAANTREFFYLIKFLFDINIGINIVTEDEEYNINTYINDDFQKEEIQKLSNHYAGLNPKDYLSWKNKIESAIKKVQENN